MGQWPSSSGMVGNTVDLRFRHGSHARFEHLIGSHMRERNVEKGRRHAFEIVQ